MKFNFQLKKLDSPSSQISARMLTSGSRPVNCQTQTSPASSPRSARRHAHHVPSPASPRASPRASPATEDTPNLTRVNNGESAAARRSRRGRNTHSQVSNTIKFVPLKWHSRFYLKITLLSRSLVALATQVPCLIVMPLSRVAIDFWSPREDVVPHPAILQRLSRALLQLPPCYWHLCLRTSHSTPPHMNKHSHGWVSLQPHLERYFIVTRS